MSHLYVPYDSVNQLVQRFQSIHLIQDAIFPGHVDPAPNFVLVDPRLYYGTYGGLVYDTILQQPQTVSLVSSSIGHNLSIVWWGTSDPPFVGDVYALAAHGRVAVTVPLFQTLRINAIRTRPKAKSSYFGANKACRMNDESSSYSSSE